MSIKYYHLAKDEEPPDEFCAVRDIGGEPSEYTFYVPETENAKLQETLQRRDEQFGIMTELWVKQVFDNAKLRELVRDVHSLHWHGADCTECPWFDECDNHGGGCPWLGILANRMSELGIETDE